MNTNQTPLLTPKQKRFCDEYLTDRNATRAALKAGYSASTALNGQLMQLPRIRLYLQQQMDAAAGKLHLQHDTLLRELSKVAFASMAHYFDDDGKVKPLNQISADAMAAVQSISVSPDGTLRIRLCNKMAALDRIARHLNFYEAEQTPPEPVYVYLDKEDMTEDDSFDDENLKDELHAEKKKRKKAEDRRRKQEQEDQSKKPEAERPQADIDEEEYLHPPYYDENGQPLRDGAGIPYDPDYDPTPYLLDLNDTPEQVVAKMNREIAAEKAGLAKRYRMAGPN